jgi:hypothetical protein
MPKTNRKKCVPVQIDQKTVLRKYPRVPSSWPLLILGKVVLLGQVVLLGMLILGLLGSRYRGQRKTERERAISNLPLNASAIQTWKSMAPVRQPMTLASATH